MTDAFIKMKYTQKEEGLINPSLVVFPNNHPKDEYLFSNDNLDNWVLCENKDLKRKEDKLLIGQYDRIEFDAKSKKNNNNKSKYTLK